MYLLFNGGVTELIGTKIKLKLKILILNFEFNISITVALRKVIKKKLYLSKLVLNLEF